MAEGWKVGEVEGVVVVSGAVTMVSLEGCGSGGSLVWEGVAVVTAGAAFILGRGLVGGMYRHGARCSGMCTGKGSRFSARWNCRRVCGWWVVGGEWWAVGLQRSSGLKGTQGRLK